jgi:hypothetical protein
LLSINIKTLYWTTSICVYAMVIYGFYKAIQCTIQHSEKTYLIV